MSLAIFDSVNKFLLPEYCLFCGNIGNYICRKCLINELNVNFNDLCHVCGSGSFKRNLHQECEDSTNLDKLFFFCEYNKSAKRIIEEIKYKGYYALVNSIGVHMARYLLFREPLISKSSYVITYVPSFIFKENSRGFNQSELLAKTVANSLNIPCKGMLVKTKGTSKQAGANKEHRNLNLRNTFSIADDTIPRKVIIIDDVHTTGATLNECAGLLKRAGCKEVFGFTFAKSLNFSTEVIRAGL